MQYQIYRFNSIIKVLFYKEQYLQYTENTIELLSPEIYMNIFGANEKNLSSIEKGLDVKISVHGSNVKINGEKENISNAVEFFNKLSDIVSKGKRLDKSSLLYAISLAKSGQLDSLDEIINEVIITNSHGRPIKCKTLMQRQYVNDIRDHQLTICTGPAGTGKTYLAMAMAVKALRQKEVEKIVLTRPAVEAGEKLGFLPGDLSQKVDPYLKPLFDALFEFVGADYYQNLIEKNIVEIAPLAYMRGRTLSNSFIILDEAQNTTCEQMKMFLTRMGNGSKVVITGDITQIDLQNGKQSGLNNAVQVLSNVEEISIIRLGDADVVRNELVQKIVKAYENFSREV